MRLPTTATVDVSRLVAALERALLGSAMAIAAALLEWQLGRATRRAQRVAAPGSKSPRAASDR